MRWKKKYLFVMVGKGKPVLLVCYGAGKKNTPVGTQKST